MVMRALRRPLKFAGTCYAAVICRGISLTGAWLGAGMTLQTMPRALGNAMVVLLVVAASITDLVGRLLEAQVIAEMTGSAAVTLAMHGRLQRA